MSELRWNPLLREWTAVATHRMDRPQMPTEACPFCPGSGRVPDRYDVWIYPNDFPTFASPPPEPDLDPRGLYRTRSARGASDVVLYSPDHEARLPDLPVPHVRKIVDLWGRRTDELERLPGVRYVMPFENNGTAIGVTMPHPHGQIYAFPFVPPRVAREAASARAHRRRTGRCLFCDVIRRERAEGTRIVSDEDGFVAYVPFFARYPYEVHVAPRRHRARLGGLPPRERDGLARTIRRVVTAYDRLFGFPFPYILICHQAPAGRNDAFHVHVEFYPPQRSRTKLKYLAGCEQGAGTFINDARPEEKAAELRRVLPR